MLEFRHTPEGLKQFQSLSLKSKITLSKARIKAWYEYWNGEVYVAFSGGKDSTVLLNLVRQMYPEVPAVFTDTGLEFPEIREFVKTIDNVEWLKPKLPFKDVIEKYGYPVVSKRIARYVYDVRHARKTSNTRRLRLEGIRKDGTFSPMSRISKKWKRLIGAPFKISDKCCDVLKKNPTHEYEKRSGLKPYVGMMAFESMNRKSTYFEHGCNAYKLTHPRSTPIVFWKEQDVWEYIRKYEIPYSPIYDMGYTRTGCIFCMFGAHLEGTPGRFQLLAKTHPKQYSYCMNKLGLNRVLDVVGVPYKPNKSVDDSE